MEARDHSRSIAILDFGGQYAHLIGSRIRRFGAFSEIHDPETRAADLRHAAGIILSGGPQSVYENGSPQADPAIFDLGVPVLGICYGHQWIAQQLGGTVTPGTTKEYGRADMRITDAACPLFSGVPEHTVVWMSHGDTVATVPDGFSVCAASDDCPVAAMENRARRIFGVQFHLEVTHSDHGLVMLRRFVDLCDPAPWSIASYAESIGASLRQEVGDRNVFLLVSGGVDSSVAFVLLNRVLGPQRVQGLLVDTGLMRAGEADMIRDAFAALGIDNLHIEEAADAFFAALEGVCDPEEKRRRIGDTFLAVQREVAEGMGLTPEEGWMLGQGTIYPDTIETGATKHADTIKTHHNRVPAIERMIEQGLVVEPLKELYKDEVRALGEELGLPHALVWRHPFPGPGLGVRILCNDGTPDTLPASPDALADTPHAVLPLRSVGVQGDGRSYRHAVVLFADEPCRVSDAAVRFATVVPNAGSDFNRVLQCTSHASPQAFHVHAMTVTPDRADLLRAADAIVDEEMRHADLYERIWQFPVVLLPMGIAAGGQTIVLRPIASTDAMTANAFVLPPDVLERMTGRLRALDGIDAVLLDLTNKPPGTIEWE